MNFSIIKKKAKRKKNSIQVLMEHDASNLVVYGADRYAILVMLNN